MELTQQLPPTGQQRSVVRKRRLRFPIPRDSEYLTLPMERYLIRRAQSGDIGARNTVVETHYPLIYKIVYKLAGFEHPLVSDLFNEGVLGDIEGVMRYGIDYRPNQRYLTYGYWWIRHYVKRALRTEDQVNLGVVSSATTELDALTFANPVESSNPVLDLINSANGGLSDQQKQVLLLTFQDEWYLESIANELGCSTRWVSHLRKTAIETLREIHEAEG